MTVPVGQLTPTVTPPRRKRGVRYQTYRKDVDLAAGETVHYKKGRGFYDAPGVPHAKPSAAAGADTAWDKYLHAVLAPLDAAEQARLRGVTAQRQQVQSANASVAAALAKDVAPQGAMYDNALAQQNQLAANAAGALSAANPNARIQSDLQLLGAPASQQQQITDANQGLFNQGAGVLYTQAGAIPGAGLLQQKAADQTYLSSLPLVASLAGQQTVGGLLRGSADAHARYLASRGDTAFKARELWQQNLAAQEAAAQKQANVERQFELEAQAAGLKTEPKPDPTLSSKYGYIVDQYGNPIPNSTGGTIPVSKTTKPPARPKVNASLSGKLGYEVDEYGDPILDANGKRIPVPRAPGKPGKAGKAKDPQGRGFYKVRGQAFSKAKTLYGGPNQGGTKLGFSTGPKHTRPTRAQAYSQLWTLYAPQLINQYGYKRAAIQQMLNVALDQAGYPARTVTTGGRRPRGG